MGSTQCHVLVTFMYAGVSSYRWKYTHTLSSRSITFTTVRLLLHLFVINYGWQTLDPPHVRLRLDAGDRAWLDRLQLRRPDAEMRGEGEVARWLGRDDERNNDGADVPDAKGFMADISTVKARKEELERYDECILE